MITVVTTPTQEIWDKVCKKAGLKDFDYWTSNNKDTCINISAGGYSSRGYYENYPNEYRIISYKEYLGMEDTAIKFKVGDRVKVIDNNHSNFGCITTIGEWEDNGDDNNWCIGNQYSSIENPYGLKAPLNNTAYGTQLELIGENKMARRTFKLVKETPTIKKGAIMQEACDDGTQEYILLDMSFWKDTEFPNANSVKIYKRSLVEDSSFYVEVFKVDPEYMTAEELKKHNEFMAKKPAKKVVEVKKAVKKGKK